MSDQWLYRIHGQEFGPVALDLVRSLIANGTIAPGDEVRNTNNSNWILACAATELRDSIKTSNVDLSNERRTARDEWFCRRQNKNLGPLKMVDLIEMAAEGELAPDDEIKAKADDYWQQVRSFRRLIQLLPFGRSPNELLDQSASTTALRPYPKLKLHSENRLESDVTENSMLDRGLEIQLKHWLDQIVPNLDVGFDWIGDTRKLPATNGQNSSQNPNSRSDKSGGRPNSNSPKKVEDLQENDCDSPILIRFPSDRSAEDCSPLLDSGIDGGNNPLLERTINQEVREILSGTGPAKSRTTETERKSSISFNLDQSLTIEDTDPVRMWGHQDPDLKSAKTDWFGWSGGEEFGPVSYTELLSWAVTGRLLPTDFVRRGDDWQFVPAVNIPCLFTVSAVANSLSRTKAQVANNKSIPVALRDQVPLEVQPPDAKLKCRTASHATNQIQRVATPCRVETLKNRCPEKLSPLFQQAVRCLITDSTSVGVSALLTIGLVIIGWFAFQ